MIVVDSRLSSNVANYITKDLRSSNEDSSSNVGGAILAAGSIVAIGLMFLMLLIATTYYYYIKRQRGNAGLYSYNTERYGTTAAGANSTGNKILLIGKDIFPTFYEKPYNTTTTGMLTKTTPAVRSPSSGQVNPFNNKKTPSPTLPNGGGAFPPGSVDPNNNNNHTAINIERTSNYQANITLKKEPSLGEKVGVNLEQKKQANC